MIRRGFTLIEMLVVISVIAVLAGISIPAIGYAKRITREAKCKTLIANIQAGLDLIRTSRGAYPEGPPPRLSTEQNNQTITGWSQYFGQNNAIQPVDKVLEENWRAVNKDLYRWFRMISGDSIPVSPDEQIYDSFGTGDTRRVLRYRPARFYRFDSAQTPGIPVIDQDDPPCRDSFQLWSCGWNGEDEFGAKSGDDITGWEKR